MPGAVNHDGAGRARAHCEHAHEDISIADVAAGCCVSIRAVQLAFRRHLDITPQVYLRRVRLDHAHRDLLAGDPAHDSVTAVAYRWGFSSSSRFAAYYRQAYDVPPRWVTSVSRWWRCGGSRRR